MFFSLLALIPFYFLGTFPTGIIVARLRGVDLTRSGSGNIGATNVTRLMGRYFGILTLLGDLSKGLLAVLLGGLVTDSIEFAAFAGVASVAGHCFSIPGKLKGGKGVATSLGVLLGIHPLGALACLGIFIVTTGLTKIVSVGSMTAALSSPIIFMFLNQSDPTVAAVSLLALMIVFRHRANIERLINGSESRIGNSERRTADYSADSRPSGAK